MTRYTADYWVAEKRLADVIGVFEGSRFAAEAGDSDVHREGQAVITIGWIEETPALSAEQKEAARDEIGDLFARARVVPRQNGPIVCEATVG